MDRHLSVCTYRSEPLEKNYIKSRLSSSLELSFTPPNDPTTSISTTPCIKRSSETQPSSTSKKPSQSHCLLFFNYCFELLFTVLSYPSTPVLSFCLQRDQHQTKLPSLPTVFSSQGFYPSYCSSTNSVLSAQFTCFTASTSATPTASTATPSPHLTSTLSVCTNSFTFCLHHFTASIYTS